ncbi:hypothetical protein ACWFQT_07090, partial [Cellulosimicrobium cellulans]
MVIISHDAASSRRRLVVPALVAALVLAPLAAVPAVAHEPAAALVVEPGTGEVIAPDETDATTPDVADVVIAPATDPVIVGEARVGGTLSVSSDPWGPEGVELAVSWYADGTLLDGVVGSDLALPPALVGARVHAELVGSLPGSGAEPVTRVTAATDPVME